MNLDSGANNLLRQNVVFHFSVSSVLSVAEFRCWTILEFLMLNPGYLRYSRANFLPGRTHDEFAQAAAQFKRANSRLGEQWNKRYATQQRA